VLKTRVIPCLLLKGEGLVKTTSFKKPRYLGDPRNVVRIFNTKEVDELILLDITATNKKRKPNFELIKDIVSECFMPVCYGGGIQSLEDIRQLLFLGVEKVAINSYAIKRPEFIKEASAYFGSQSIVAAIDVKKSRRNKYHVFRNSGKVKTKYEPREWLLKLAEFGAGEILLTSTNRDGLMQGYDNELIHNLAHAVDIPIIACGGAGKLADMVVAVKNGASAVAGGSIFVYQGIHRAVLINYPEYDELEGLLQSLYNNR